MTHVIPKIIYTFLLICIYIIPAPYYWKDKTLIPDRKRNVDSEMLECGIDIETVREVLDTGIIVRKRKKGVIEKWKRFGKEIVIIAIEEQDFFISIRHVGRIRAKKKM